MASPNIASMCECGHSKDVHYISSGECMICGCRNPIFKAPDIIIGECEFCSEVKGHYIKTTADGQDLAACSKCGRVSIWNPKKVEGVERDG